MIRVFHQRNKCIGCNACAELDPANWKMSRKDGKATLVGATGKKDILYKKLEEAERAKQKTVVRHCPSRCIRIEG
ncbi:MAG: ferredoxin [Bacteroidia bacterium]|nr:ferredoxin [Bacteroidia bacterium]